MATYDPKGVTASLGSITLADFGSDSMIKVTREGDEFEIKQGAAGYTEWVNKNSNIHTITFNIMQTSAVNDALSTLLKSDRTGNGGALEFSLKDVSGYTVIAFAEARIVKTPDWEFSASNKERTWTLKAGKATEYTLAGNTL